MQEAKHADGSTITMVGQAAKHPEKPRVMLRLRLFKPTSPNERTAAMAASMSREAKQLPTVLPIEQTPTGNMISKHPFCLQDSSLCEPFIYFVIGTTAMASVAA